MKKNINRRDFIQATALAGVGISLGMGAKPLSALGVHPQKGKRIGIIGLDSSHSLAFTRIINGAVGTELGGYKVVAAYPFGSKDLELSIKRIPEYTAEIQQLNVVVVDSIKQLLKMVDVVLLETNDGRLHLEQALPILQDRKPLFIDKPIAASLADAAKIFKASEKYNVPVFSSSSLRFMVNVQAVARGEIGKVLGAETYSPALLEKTHPDLYWYGIHGVETLFTVMGQGCKSVIRLYTPQTDVVIGTWHDSRIGIFRGIRSGKQDFGGTCFGERGIMQLGPYLGYHPLLQEIIKFFQTGKSPVSAPETLEILAFMDAADASKERGGVAVTLQEMYDRAGVSI